MSLLFHETSHDSLNNYALVLVFSIGSVAPPTTQRIYTEADLSDLLLGEIAKEIGKDWKMLSRHLGLPEYEIQSINQAYMFDLHEASFQALLR